MPSRPDPNLSGSSWQRERWASSGHGPWHCDERRREEEEEEEDEEALDWNEAGPLDTPEGATLAYLALRGEQRRAPALALRVQRGRGATAGPGEDASTQFGGIPERHWGRRSWATLRGERPGMGDRAWGFLWGAQAGRARAEGACTTADRAWMVRPGWGRESLRLRRSGPLKSSAPWVAMNGHGTPGWH